jgi:hypothetical protein
VANGPLSPVMMIASAGLLQNQGLEISGNLVTAVAGYESSEPISSLLAVIQQAASAGNTVISAATLQDLRDLGSGIQPVLTDSFSNSMGPTPAGQFSGAVIARAQTIMGSGDLTVFSQIFNTSRAYLDSANQFVNSANNTEQFDVTFVNMDAITTGGFSLVSNDITKFGEDLLDLGTVFDPKTIDTLGYPSALIRQVLQAGGLLPVLQVPLAENDVGSDLLATIAEASVPLAGDIERRIYQSMQSVTGDALQQVLFMLDANLSGVNQMSDLLDPYLLFPRSWQDLVMLVGEQTRNIYVGPNTVNTQIEAEFITDNKCMLLKKIIPAGAALANRALARSLQQIKNLGSLTLPDMARSSSLVQSNQGLEDILALTTAVPAQVQADIKASVAPNGLATGENDTYVLYDFIGTAAGYPYDSDFPDVVEALDQVLSQGGFQPLLNNSNGAYTVMSQTLAGSYGDPITGPITGVPAPFNQTEPYANADVAFQTYIPITQGILSNIANTYVDQITSAGTSYQNMLDQYNREPQNWQLAMLEIDELLGNNRPAVLSLTTGLHEIGLDESPRGSAEFFVAVSNTATSAGQAVIASLREGRNIRNLENAGIGMDTQLSDR